MKWQNVAQRSAKRLSRARAAAGLQLAPVLIAVAASLLLQSAGLSAQCRGELVAGPVSVLDELERQRILPVLRCADAEDTIATARAAAA